MIFENFEIDPQYSWSIMLRELLDLNAFQFV